MDIESGAGRVSFLNRIMSDIADRFLCRLDDIAMGIIAFIIFWLAAKLVRRILTAMAPGMRAETSSIILVSRLIYGAILVFGLTVALNAAGIDWTALAAGLGLTGFALGFALKDAISNYLSGMLLLFYRPFKAGDKVKVGGITGVVMDIRVRDTVIVDEGGLKNIIPNASVFGNAIVNYTESEPTGPGPPSE